MNIDELKKSMATLDDVLAQNSREEVRFDFRKCEAAQKRVIRHFSRASFMCFIIGTVYMILWLAGQGEDAFPLPYKGFLGFYLIIAAGWYAIMSIKARRIDLATSAPVTAMKNVASLRLCALCGEIVLGLALAAFFALFLANLLQLKSLAFWLTVGGLAVGVVVSVVFFLPKTIRDFRDLTAVR